MPSGRIVHVLSYLTTLISFQYERESIEKILMLDQWQSQKCIIKKIISAFKAQIYGILSGNGDSQ